MIKLGLSVNSWLAKQIRDKQVQTVELLKKSLEFSCHQCMTHGWLQMHSSVIQGRDSRRNMHITGGGGEVRKFKDIIFGSCVWF